MKRVSIALCSLAIIASYLVVFLPQPSAARLLHEDGPVEEATVVFFLVACAGFVQVWMLRGGRASRDKEGDGRRMAFLVLAALMFLCAGEELSWGQRIFGWETPPGWSAANAQAETNLHNLALIEGGVRDARTQTFLRSLTNANRLFAVFWFALFVVVPVLDRTSARARRVIRAVGIPIAPWWIGALFVLNHGLFFIANHYLNTIGSFSSEAFPLDELKEHNGAWIYAVVGLAAWLRERASASAAVPLPHRA